MVFRRRYRVEIARRVLALLPRARNQPEDREKAAMPAPDASLSGPRLLAAVTEAMVAFHQRYYHRKPVTATICRRVVSAGASRAGLERASAGVGGAVVLGP